MSSRICCVSGCNSTSATDQLFCFPKNDYLRNMWMSFLVPHNSLLLGLSTGQLLKKRVCHKHFDKGQFDRDGRRIRFSYPCLFTEREIAHGTQLSSTDWHALSDHNYIKECDEDEIIIPESSLVNDWHSLTDHNYFKECDVDEIPTLKSSLVMGKTDVSLTQPSCSYTDKIEHQFEASTSISDVSLIQPSCSYTDKIEKITPKPISVAKKFSSKKRKIIKMISSEAQQSIGHPARERLEKAQNVCSGDQNLLKQFEDLPKQAKTFLMMQLKQLRKSKMARRFTFEEKMIAFTLMKQSPKGYKLLEKMFSLPNKRTLHRLSEKINFEPGLNPHIFEHIRNVTKEWDIQKKLCTIVYDEVALSPHLSFDEHKDIIIGFEDVAGNRKMKFCDHALVIMLRGICSSWRQCVAYYFCTGTVSAKDVKQILEDTVSQVTACGLIPLGLVSDQGSTFRSAIRNIRQETIRSRYIAGVKDDGTVDISGQNLSIFFDSPHLLKSIRNNFVSKDMIFKGNTASWRDIMFIYDIDSQLGHDRNLHKVSAYHVVPEKIKKMKVSMAAQVLSSRTAALLKYTNAVCKITDSTTMGATADVVAFFNQLFDSVNGSPGGCKKGTLRKPIKSNSPHQEFWKEAIKTIKTIVFKDTNSKLAVQKGNPRLVKVPCLQGWVTSLESFLRIAKILFEKYKVPYFYPRFINQDPLENFFGRVRALNYRNVNPDSVTFRNSFKSIVLSNILSPHSRFANCETDNGETLLQLEHLFQMHRNDDSTSNKENVSPLPVCRTNLQAQAPCSETPLKEKMKVQCSAYIAGYICRKMKNKINCNKCNKTFVTDTITNIHQYINFREYKLLKNKNLAYPTELFTRTYREAAQFVQNLLNIHCFKRNIGSLIRQNLKKNVNLTWLGCKAHSPFLQDFFISLITRLQTHNWCKTINKILKGVIDEKYVEKMKEPQKLALLKYKSYRLRKKKLNK